LGETTFRIFGDYAATRGSRANGGLGSFLTDPTKEAVHDKKKRLAGNDMIQKHTI
jgi:hypothetical protein